MTVAPSPANSPSTLQTAQTDRELRVLILAPLGRDSELIKQFIEQAGLACEICTDLTQYSDPIHTFGAVVLTSEALTSVQLPGINAALATQPAWSNLPIILLLRHDMPEVKSLWRAEVQKLSSHAMVLKRPVKPETLISLLRGALESRRWQYKVRDSLVLDADVIRRTNDANALLEAAVVRQTARLRAAASELILVEERERRRLSHILHDDYQQLLTAAAMHLSVLAGRKKDASTGDILQTVDTLIRQAIGTARSLAKDLSPPVLDQHGLAAAIRWLGEQMLELHNLTVEVIDDTEQPIEPMDPNLRSFIYQVARELLFNVVKHARIDRAKVSISRTDHVLTLVVEDHGAGMGACNPDSQTDNDVTGFGLPSIEHRLDLLGGSFDMTSTPGRGCKVTVCVPIPAASAGRRKHSKKVDTLIEANRSSGSAN